MKQHYISSAINLHIICTALSLRPSLSTGCG